MTVKKALIISTLAVILTGITACAVAYTKKTGNSPFKTMETSATYDITTYNYTNDTWTITGTTNPNIDDPSYYTRTYLSGNYTITRTTQQLTIVYNFDKLYNMYQGYMYTFPVNETVTQTFTNNELPNPLVNITLIQNGVETEYDEEEQANISTFYIDTFLNYHVQNEVYRKESHIYLYQTTQPFNDDDNGLILDQVKINTTLATLSNTYQTGWTNGNQGQQDIVDIRGLMLNILTMPFTFISQAFNITMWEGTPYQINLSRLILSLIAIASILFIIKLFTSGFSVIGNYTGNKTNSRLDRQNKRSQTRLNNAKADKIEKGK